MRPSPNVFCCDLRPCSWHIFINVTTLTAVLLAHWFALSFSNWGIGENNILFMRVLSQWCVILAWRGLAHNWIGDIWVETQAWGWMLEWLTHNQWFLVSAFVLSLTTICGTGTVIRNPAILCAIQSMKTSNRKSCVAGSRTDAEHWYNLKRSPGPYHYPQTIHYKFESTFKSICMAKPLQIVNIIWIVAMLNQYI